MYTGERRPSATPAWIVWITVSTFFRGKVRMLEVAKCKYVNAFNLFSLIIPLEEKG
jgi:hypothetical protein